jgi:hypothetical protein
MAKNIVKLPNLNAVAAGQTATLDVPLGPTYHAIYLIYKESGTLASEVNLKAGLNDYRVKINGKAQRTLSATQSLEINQIYQAPFNAGCLPIFFAEPWRRTGAGEDSLAWGTQDVSTFQIEVDIDAAATAPTIEAYAEISRVRRPLGIISKNRRFTIGVTSTGERQIQNLPKIGTSYAALHMFETTAADISEVLVEIDQTKVWETPAFLANAVYDVNEITTQSGIFSTIFDFDRRVSSTLSMVKSDGSVVSDFMVTTTMAVAADFTIVTEEFGPRW